MLTMDMNYIEMIRAKQDISRTQKHERLELLEDELARICIRASRQHGHLTPTELRHMEWLKEEIADLREELGVKIEKQGTSPQKAARELQQWLESVLQWEKEFQMLNS